MAGEVARQSTNAYDCEGRRVSKTAFKYRNWIFTLPIQFFRSPPPDGHEVLFAGFGGRTADAAANDAESHKIWICMHPASQTSELAILAGSRDVKMITAILRNQLHQRVRGGLNGGNDDAEEFAVSVKVRKMDEDQHDDGDDDE